MNTTLEAPAVVGPKHTANAALFAASINRRLSAALALQPAIKRHALVAAIPAIKELIATVVMDMAQGREQAGSENDPVWLAKAIVIPLVRAAAPLIEECRATAEANGIDADALVSDAAYWTAKDRAAYVAAKLARIEANRVEVPMVATVAVVEGAAPTESKRGRPAGSKNVAAKVKAKPALPVHDVPSVESAVPAALDVLWRKDGLLMSELIAQMAFVGVEPRQAMAILHAEADKATGARLEKTFSGKTAAGKTIERWRAIGKRTGWYSATAKVGRLYTATEIHARAKIDISRWAICKRLDAGMTPKQAATNPLEPRKKAS